MEIRDHRLTNTIFKPSPNQSSTIVPTLIVMHHTGGWPDGEGSISWMLNPKSEVSAHLVIDYEGNITQLVPFNKKAWHAGSGTSSFKNMPPNDISIGIELANPGRLNHKAGVEYYQDGNPDMVFSGNQYSIQHQIADWDEGHYIDFVHNQMEASVEVCKALVAEYGIDDITTHQFCDPTRKVDPHPGFDLTTFEARVFDGAHVSDSKPIATTKNVTVAYKWPSYETPVRAFPPGAELTVNRKGTYINGIEDYMETAVWYCVGDDELWVHERDVT